MLRRFSHGLIHLTDTAFDVQIVRRGVRPKALIKQTRHGEAQEVRVQPRTGIAWLDGEETLTEPTVRRETWS